MSRLSRLSGRLALVTGASGGIGRALARGLAAEGADVALAYGAAPDPAQKLAAEIARNGGRAVALGCDLRQPEATGRLVAAVEESLGPVDILVSNAGLGRRQELEEVSPADFDEMVAVNLRAPFLLAQRTLPGMRERGFGRILFMSSAAAFTGGIVGPHYAASKAGLHGLTHFLATRMAPSGITVGRLGEPEEVADLALAIIDNAYLTNQVISLDGGMHAR